MSAATVKGEGIMTDYQFRTILKMVLDIVRRAKSTEEVEKALIELIGEKSKDEETH